MKECGLRIAPECVVTMQPTVRLRPNLHQHFAHRHNPMHTTKGISCVPPRPALLEHLVIKASICPSSPRAMCHKPISPPRDDILQDFVWHRPCIGASLPMFHRLLPKVLGRSRVADLDEVELAGQVWQVRVFGLAFPCVCTWLGQLAWPRLVGWTPRYSCCRRLRAGNWGSSQTPGTPARRSLHLRQHVIGSVDCGGNDSESKCTPPPTDTVQVKGGHGSNLIAAQGR